MISGFDKWLTTPPEERYYDYLEEVIEYYSDEIMEDDIFHAKWFDSEIEHKWISNLHYRDIPIKEAAEILERGFYIYKNIL